MKQEDIRRLINENSQLPTLLNFYARFREKIADPQTSAVEIANLVSSDPAVSSNVLRTANSSFYGLMNRIMTIPHAIVIIGFSGVHFIVLNTAVFSLFKHPESSEALPELRKLWKHSVAVARLARIIAKKMCYIAFEEVFTAGLLHDIGKVFIFKNFPEEFRNINAGVHIRKALMYRVEQDVMGFTHMQVGEMLLRGWNLPETLIATAAYHHEPGLAKDKVKVVSAVHCANILAHSLEIGSSADDAIEMVDPGAWAELGLADTAIDEIVHDAQEELLSKDLVEEL